MNRYNLYRAVMFLMVAITLFTLGRYSAYGEAQRIPMSPDQILVGVSMVKATTEILDGMLDRIVDIGERRAIGQLTPSTAKEMIQTERNAQLSRVSTAVTAALGRTAQVSKEFTVPADQLSEDMLNLIEYVQTKYPALFNRFLN